MSTTMKWLLSASGSVLRSSVTSVEERESSVDVVSERFSDLEAVREWDFLKSPPDEPILDEDSVRTFYSQSSTVCHVCHQFRSLFSAFL